MFQWGPTFEYFIRQILTNQWTPAESLWKGMEENSVIMTPFSSRVDLTTRTIMLNAQREIIEEGKEVFCGNLTTRDDIVISPYLPEHMDKFKENGCMTDDAMLSMNFLLKGVYELGIFIPPPKEPPQRAYLEAMAFTLHSITLRISANPSEGGNAIVAFKIEWDTLSNMQSSRNCSTQNLCVIAPVPKELQVGQGGRPLSVTIEFTLDELAPQTTVFIQASAFDDSSFGQNGGPIIASTASHPPPVLLYIDSRSVTNVTFHLIAKRSDGGNPIQHIRLEWDRSSEFYSERNCTAQTFCKFIQVNPQIGLLSDTIELYSTATGLLPDTLYYFRASSFDGVEYGGISSIRSGSTAGAPRISDYRVTLLKENDILVNFRTTQAVDGLSVKYVIIRTWLEDSPDFNFDSTVVSMSNIIAFTDSFRFSEHEGEEDLWVWKITLEHGSQYYISIAASDGIQEGEFTTPRLVSVPQKRELFQVQQDILIAVFVFSSLVGLFIILCMIGVYYTRK